MMIQNSLQSAIPIDAFNSLPAAGSPAQNAAAPLFPAAGAGVARSALDAGNRAGIIIIGGNQIAPINGYQTEQAVGPKAPSGGDTSSSATPANGADPNTWVSSSCEDGALANAGSMAGQMAGSELGPSAEWELGEAGKLAGGAVCTVIDSIPDPTNTGPDSVYDPADYGGGGACTDQGPTGGQSAGTDAPSCAEGSNPVSSENEPVYMGEVDDPSFLNGGQSSSSAEGGQSSSGAESSSSAEYLGEVDDPSFVQDQSNSSSSAPVSSQGGERPPDDGSGPVGPNARGGERPPDDGTGPIGPGANVASMAQAMSTFNAFALSQQQLR
jgi:hypothetical protein